jgi:hypothetical protein
MTPFSPGQDIFQTQADQRFNSFSEPFNPVNLNPGKWGIDPSLLTPSYMSPYRPQYQGPQGNQLYGATPGFFNSVNSAFNPFSSWRSGTNYGGNSYQQNQGYYDSIGFTPVDWHSSIIQKYVFPAIATHQAFRHFSRPSYNLGSGLGQGITRGIMGNSASIGATGSAMGTAGRVGGVLADLTLPFVAAQAAVWGADKMIFDPYVAQRNTARGLRNNFFGISMGEGMGNFVTGGGFSRTAAAGISKDISRMGAYDPTFNQNEMSLLTDYSARAGLFDMSMGSQITSKMKEITKQVKLVMSIANTSDFRETVELLARIQQAGATGASASNVFTKLGGYASAAGMSTMKMMNTVGAQGQFLFQANGLTPYVGQLVAGQAAASFATAQRSGLLSPALMARMGGVEGATQASTTGITNLLQSPYAAAIGMNSYFLGGDKGSILGNLGRLGGHLSGNTLNAIGNMNLVRPALVSRMAEDGGLKNAQEKISQFAKVLPGTGSRIDAGRAYMILTQGYGMGDTEARGILQQLKTYQDPSSVNQQLSGIQRRSIDSMHKALEQEGLNYGIFTQPIYGFKQQARRLQAVGVSMSGSILEKVANIGDFTEKFMTSGLMGSDSMDIITNEHLTGAGKMLYLNDSRLKQKRLDEHLGYDRETGSITLFRSKHVSTLAKLNANSNNKDVQRLYSAKTDTEKMNVIDKLAETGVIPEEYKDISKQRELVRSLKDIGTTTKTISDLNVDKILTEKLNSKLPRAKYAELAAYAEYLEAKGDTDKLQDIGSRLNSATGLGLESEGGVVSTRALKAHFARRGAELGSSGIAHLGELLGEAGKELGMSGIELASQISDPKSRESLANRLGLSSAGSTEDQFMAMLAQKRGYDLTTPGISVSRSRMAGSEFHEENAKRSIALGKQSAEIRALHRSGKIDFTTEQNMLNVLDHKRAISDFGDHVKEFGTYIKGMGGAGGDPLLDKIVSGSNSVKDFFSKRWGN